MEVQVAVPHLRIRHGEPQDLPYLLDLSEGFLRYSGAFDLGLDYNRTLALQFLEQCMVKDDFCVVVAIDLDTGNHAGTIAGFLTPWPWGKQIHVQELWWWVEPDYRSAKLAAGKILVEYLQAWGESRGASHLIMVTPGDASGKDDTLKRLYKRKGFTYCETHFIREV